jgi:hypothetical protein
MIRLLLCICLLTAALKADKTVVAIFGSEACPWSQELQEKVWGEETFQTLMQAKGFETKALPASGKEPETPILKLYLQNKEIGYLGYLPIPPEKYVALFEEMVEIENLALHQSCLNCEQLLILYRKSCLYNMPAQEKLLKAGLAVDKGESFLLEQYALLCKDHPRKAKKVKEEIRKRSSQNAPIEWRLATLVAEAKKERGEELAVYVKPLRKFLRTYSDPEFAWRCHLLLSEYYFEQNQTQEGKFHEEKALKDAPAEIKAMIRHE